MSNRKKTSDIFDPSTLRPEDIAEIVGTDKEEVLLVQAQHAYARKLARQVRYMRETRKLSVGELANLLAVSKGRVSQMESGEIRHVANHKVFSKIGHLLGFRPTHTIVDLRNRRVPWEQPPMRVRIARDKPALTMERLANLEALRSLTIGQVALFGADALGYMARVAAGEVFLQRPDLAKMAFLTAATKEMAIEESSGVRRRKFVAEISRVALRAAQAESSIETLLNITVQDVQKEDEVVTFGAHSHSAAVALINESPNIERASFIDAIAGLYNHNFSDSR